jgi:hypothetical protein
VLKVEQIDKACKDVTVNKKFPPGFAIEIRFSPLPESAKGEAQLNFNEDVCIHVSVYACVCECVCV